MDLFPRMASESGGEATQSRTGSSFFWGQAPVFPDGFVSRDGCFLHRRCWQGMNRLGDRAEPK